MSKNLSILLVEDDPLWVLSIKEKISKYGHPTIVSTMKEALNIMDEQLFDLAIFDLDLEVKLGGLKLVEKAKRIGLYNIILSANEANDIIKEGYFLGCMDYLTKPISEKACDLVFKKYDLIHNSEKVESLIQKRFITEDEQTLNSLEIIKRINLSDKSVLITGESGTGKTCLAKLIHDISTGEKTPFVSLNCSQFNESTIDSELFGHVKGAFTGALKDKIGLIEKSENGTLFLDEVHSLSTRAQQKLLKALDEGIIYPVGSEKPKLVKFKVICASCEDLNNLIVEGSFRRDLYYRIKTFEIHLNPLRKRKKDILPLINYYLGKFDRKMILSEEVENALLEYNWPANTREIEDIVENWNVLGVGVVNLSDLPEHMTSLSSKIIDEDFFTADQFRLLNEIGLKEFTEILKEKAIKLSLDQNNGKQVEAAKRLKMSKSAMSKALDKYRGDSYVQ